RAAVGEPKSDRLLETPSPLSLRQTARLGSESPLADYRCHRRRAVRIAGAVTVATVREGRDQRRSRTGAAAGGLSAAAHASFDLSRGPFAHLGNERGRNLRQRLVRVVGSREPPLLEQR